MIKIILHVSLSKLFEVLTDRHNRPQNERWKIYHKLYNTAHTSSVPSKHVRRSITIRPLLESTLNSNVYLTSTVRVAVQIFPNWNLT